MFKKLLFIIFILLISLLLSNSVLSRDSKKCYIEDETIVFFKSSTNTITGSSVIGKTKVIIIRDLDDIEVKNLNKVTGLNFTGAKTLIAEKITIFCRFHGSHTYEYMVIVFLKKDLICESMVNVI